MKKPGVDWTPFPVDRSGQFGNYNFSRFAAGKN
jgi:hypothetical protein